MCPSVLCNGGPLDHLHKRTGAQARDALPWVPPGGPGGQDGCSVTHGRWSLTSLAGTPPSVGPERPVSPLVSLGQLVASMPAFVCSDPLLPCLWQEVTLCSLFSGRKSKAKPNGKKPAAEEKKMYLEPEYAKSRITDVGFKELVVLPREIDLNEWLASNSACGHRVGKGAMAAAGGRLLQASPQLVAGPAVRLGSPPHGDPAQVLAVPGSICGVGVRPQGQQCPGHGKAVAHGTGGWLSPPPAGQAWGSGLRAHKLCACPTPCGGDSARWPLPVCPAWHRPSRRPSPHSSGWWPASRAGAVRWDMCLWSAVGAGCPRVQGKEAVPRGRRGGFHACPFSSLLFQPPRFSTMSTCSTAPSLSFAQERHARRWPCATRESLPGCSSDPGPSHCTRAGSPDGVGSSSTASWPGLRLLSLWGRDTRSRAQPGQGTRQCVVGGCPQYMPGLVS